MRGILYVLVCFVAACMPFAPLIEGTMTAVSVASDMGCDSNGCTHPTVAAAGGDDPNRPIPASTHTDAGTAQIASTAWLAAVDGNCPRALEALEVVAARDPDYFAHLALDPTFAACRP